MTYRVGVSPAPMEPQEATRAYMERIGIDVSEYIDNPFMQGGVAFGQWMDGRFKDDSLADNPYEDGLQEYDDWQTGFDDWADAD